MYDEIPSIENDVHEIVPQLIEDEGIKVHELGNGEVGDQREVFFELKMNLLRTIAGSGTTLDDKEIIPLWSVDPYPTAVDSMLDTSIYLDHEKRYPMSRHFFRWITSRLHIAPVEKAHPASNNGDYYALQFDRKYDEEVIFLDDGSLVIVQILFGVIPDGRLRSDKEHGCPSAANQYCNINDVNSLVTGLTIGVYDIRSDINKAIKLFDKGLSRIADIVEIPAFDLPKISQKLIQLMPVILKLERMGKLCTAVTLDPSKLQKSREVFAHDDVNTSSLGKYRFVGHNLHISSKRSSRLQRARKLSSR